MSLYIQSFICGFIAGPALYGIIKWISSNRTKTKSGTNQLQSDEKNDCIFFSPEGMTLQCLKNPPNVYCSVLSCSACNCKKYISHIENTKTSLDICVYLITLEELTNVIIKLLKKGVFIRIITDKQMSDEATNSRIVVFCREHVPIKVIDSSGMMHNKFAIIDNRKLISGSLNWTRQGFNGNFENALIIHDAEIIKKYLTYFEDIWLSH